MSWRSRSRSQLLGVLVLKMATPLDRDLHSRSNSQVSHLRSCETTTDAPQFRRQPSTGQDLPNSYICRPTFPIWILWTMKNTTKGEAELRDLTASFDMGWRNLRRDEQNSFYSPTQPSIWADVELDTARASFCHANFILETHESKLASSLLHFYIRWLDGKSSRTSDGGEHLRVVGALHTLSKLQKRMSESGVLSVCNLDHQVHMMMRRTSRSDSGQNQGAVTYRSADPVEIYLYHLKPGWEVS